MRKTIVKTKLVLHAQAIRALTDKDLVRAGAGQGANNNDVTHPNTGCPGAGVGPDPA